MGLWSSIRRPPVQGSADPAALESQLLWVWGSPRSGSSWLLQLLSHPLKPDPDLPLGFRLPANPAPWPHDSVPIDETFLSNHMAPALADPRLVDGRWVPGTINNLLADKPAYAFSNEYAPSWRPALRGLALHRIGAVLERARDEGVELAPAPLVPIKETNGSHAADIVMATLPRSRMMLLIRDGRDVVDSLMHAYQPGGFMATKQGQAFTTPEQRQEGVRWAARLWACNTDVTLRAMESHPAELARVVRYEDLLTDTASVLADLYEWSGLQRETGWIEHVVAVHSFAALPAERKGPLTRNRAATPGLWRENLTESERDLVEEICGPLLGRFGYRD